ncbi:MAG: hypothetical protein NTW86_17855 [Candidatus Sumerlaeota bacterium]|nr:hypothetical protein [Candidatus Sumerlaeota bacterium]
MTPPPPLPHDKKTLLREVDASIKIRDIKQMDRLRDQVDVKWWESGLILLLFVCALGFMISTALYLTAQSPRPGELLSAQIHTDAARLADAAKALQRKEFLLKAVFIWFLPMVFSIILTLEVILRKINALRRLHHVSAQILETLRKDLARPSARPEGSTESKGEKEENRSQAE